MIQDLVGSRTLLSHAQGSLYNEILRLHALTGAAVENNKGKEK